MTFKPYPFLKYSFFYLALFCFYSCQDEKIPTTLFTSLPSSSTNITFNNKITEGSAVNIVQYLYAYNGGGVAIGDINNDSLPDIFFTANEGHNQLYLNQGNLTFKNISASAGNEILCAHFVNGQEEPLHQLDELASQSPLIKKQYSDYQSFSQQAFSEIFPDEKLRGSIVKKAVTLASSYFENDGSGNFKSVPLPGPAQVSPIQKILIEDLDHDGYLDIIAAGNLFDVAPTIGRFDASYGSFLKGDGKGGFESVDVLEKGLAIQGQVKDMETLESKQHGNILLVAKNDEALEIFKILSLKKKTGQ